MRLASWPYAGLLLRDAADRFQGREDFAGFAEIFGVPGAQGGTSSAPGGPSSASAARCSIDVQVRHGLRSPAWRLGGSTSPGTLAILGPVYRCFFANSTILIKRSASGDREYRTALADSVRRSPLQAVNQHDCSEARVTAGGVDADDPQRRNCRFATRRSRKAKRGHGSR